MAIVLVTRVAGAHASPGRERPPDNADDHPIVALVPLVGWLCQFTTLTQLELEVKGRSEHTRMNTSEWSEWRSLN
jgi:hypothetical protein